MASYVFNPAGAPAGNTTVQPRPQNVQLEEVTVDDAAAPNLDLGRRNAAQRANLARLANPRLVPIYRQDPTSDSLEALFGDRLDWAYRCYQVTCPANSALGGGPLFQSHIYLFNAIVAFEWRPSVHNVAMLERAARRAADFLFDVTDGWMTFGQVLIGGPELLDGADIQILASNRLLPRSWVGGLHERKKYMPIRAGRGLWQKNRALSIPWDEPEGFRVLVHEWAHYALELLDDYVDTHQVYLPREGKATGGRYEARRSNMSLAVPSVSQPVESIMATLEGTSELTAKTGGRRGTGKAAEWDTIINGFDGLNPAREPRFPRIKARPTPVEGPLALRELPHVAQVVVGDGPRGWSDELLLTAIPAAVAQEHCWVYVLKGVDATTGVPTSIVAQGTLDASYEEGFRLFGAEQGDDLLLIGNDASWGVRAMRATIGQLEPAGRGRKRIAGLAESDWRDVTPAVVPAVYVQPEPVVSREDRAARLRVNLLWPAPAAEAPPAAELYLFPLDEVVGPANPGGPGGGRPRVAVAPDVPTAQPLALDGLVFVKLGASCLVVIYAQGGGTPTGSPVGGTPLTPGSSEGNLMVCFEDQGEYPRGNQEHGEIRVVTTRWPGGTPSTLEGSGAEARSYAYSLCSNKALPASYLPTLTLFYDRRADLQDGEAVIHRLDEGGQWRLIASYRPSGAWYVAAPLDTSTARRLTDPGLPAGQQRVEHYRLFWVPRDPAA